MQSDGTLFTLAPHTPYGYVEQRLILERLATFGFKPDITDISPLVARMRRSKDMKEIEQMYKAVEITCLAQEAASRAIGDMVNEAEVPSGA